MKLEEILTFNCIKQNYEGIIEIYPTKCTNTMVLDKVLLELQKTHKLIKITNDWIRAFKTI